jgi:hypothetical protein
MMAEKGLRACKNNNDNDKDNDDNDDDDDDDDDGDDTNSVADSIVVITWLEWQKGPKCQQHNGFPSSNFSCLSSGI